MGLLNKLRTLQRPSKFLLLVLLVVIGHVALGVAALPWTLFYGDMTRIARLSDAHFGWRSAQPAVDAATLRSSPLSEADIVVIGDSFSAPLLWQSVLVQKGYRLTTFTWGDIGGSLCADLPDVLRKSGFKGQKIFIQSVESNVTARLQAGLVCEKTQVTQLAKGGRNAGSLSRHPPAMFSGDVKAQISAGSRTVWNTLRYWAEGTKLRIETADAAPIVVREVPDGCRLFSHSACPNALFFEANDELGAKAGTLPLMQQAQERLSPYQVHWLVIPAKGTVYFSSSSDFWTLLAQDKKLRGLDLLSLFAQRSVAMKDFYFPNDSHLSTAGYLELGQWVAESLSPALSR